MSVLRSALLEWDADRVSRVLVAALAVYLATRVTDDFLVGLGAVVLFAALFDGVRILTTRLAGPSREA